MRRKERTRRSPECARKGPGHRHRSLESLPNGGLRGKPGKPPSLLSHAEQTGKRGCGHEEAKGPQRAQVGRTHACPVPPLWQPPGRAVERRQQLCRADSLRPFQPQPLGRSAVLTAQLAARGPSPRDLQPPSRLAKAPGNQLSVCLFTVDSPART